MVWGVRGHPKSLETSPFDRAHMTSYSTLIETMGLSILYHFRVIARFSSKVANFYPPHLHLSPPQGLIPFEFRRVLWYQKTSQWLSCGIICVILCLAVLIQYRSVTDTQTDTHTHTHTHTHTTTTTTAYTALSIASRGRRTLEQLENTPSSEISPKTYVDVMCADSSSTASKPQRPIAASFQTLVLI